MVVSSPAERKDAYATSRKFDSPSWYRDSSSSFKPLVLRPCSLSQLFRSATRGATLVGVGGAAFLAGVAATQQAESDRQSFRGKELTGAEDSCDKVILPSETFNAHISAERAKFWDCLLLQRGWCVGG